MPSAPRSSWELGREKGPLRSTLALRPSESGPCVRHRPALSMPTRWNGSINRSARRPRRLPRESSVALQRRGTLDPHSPACPRAVPCSTSTCRLVEPGESSSDPLQPRPGTDRAVRRGRGAPLPARSSSRSAPALTAARGRPGHPGTPHCPAVAGAADERGRRWRLAASPCWRPVSRRGAAGRVLDRSAEGCAPRRRRSS